MKNAPKRLCWNCEGDVHVEAMHCPYCGVDLQESVVATAMTPPPPPPFQFAENQQKEHKNEESETTQVAAAVALEAPSQFQELFFRIALPLGLLSLAATLGFFSALMALFSQDGYLTLRWDASYWTIYAVFALAAAYFGWRQLENADASKR